MSTWDDKPNDYEHAVRLLEGQAMSYIGKYDADDTVFMAYRKQIHELADNPQEIVDNFPAYVGAVNQARFLALYEIYKQVINHAGHIVDIGSYKGASLLFFAKLIKLFEPYSPTEVHGFEWFKGQMPGEDDDAAQKGKYVANKGRLEKLIELQGLAPICKLHDLDLINDLEAFSNRHPHLRYKLVFVDCGIKAVMDAVVPHFWERLTVGGIMAFDHYNDPVSPSESQQVNLRYTEMQQYPFTRSPTGYFVKL